MIRLQDIQTALLPVVGWQQDYNPQNQIDDALTQSESGLTFQGAHPLCTLANVRAIMPDDYLYKYPDWKNTIPYAVGVKVKHGGKVWVAVNPNTGSAPTENNPDWAAYNMVSDFVRNLTVNGINTAVQTFIQEKQLQQETRNLLERRTFFDGAARMAATIDPTGKIVGFEIVPVRAMGVTTKIERIGLQMIGATGTVKLYLFHSSQVAPMREIELTFTNTHGGFQWFTPSEPIYLPYIPGADGDGNDAGGAWFLCYNQNELPVGMRALNVSKDWSVEPCQTCLGGSIDSWRQMTKYLQVSPFGIHAPADFAEYPEMFDIGLIGYTNTMNYGLNLEISVGCDLTDFIISQRQIFATVIQKQVVANVLRTIAMNPDVRVNRNQVNVTRDELLYELDGNPTGRATGLGYELKQAYKALSIDTRGLDRICLQCNNHGVKYRTV
jgi:hypothetical protein